MVVAGRTAASLDETVALMEARGGKALAVTTDVSRSDEVHALVAAAVDRFGSLDVAVNNAAVFHGGTPLADLPEADWHAELDINVTGVFLALQAEIRQMRTQPSGGAIVNLASTIGLHTRRPASPPTPPPRPPSPRCPAPRRSTTSPTESGSTSSAPAPPPATMSLGRASRRTSGWNGRVTNCRWAACRRPRRWRRPSSTWRRTTRRRSWARTWWWTAERRPLMRTGHPGHFRAS